MSYMKLSSYVSLCLSMKIEKEDIVELTKDLVLQDAVSIDPTHVSELPGPDSSWQPHNPWR